MIRGSTSLIGYCTTLGCFATFITCTTSPQCPAHSQATASIGEQHLPALSEETCISGSSILVTLPKGHLLLYVSFALFFQFSPSPRRLEAAMVFSVAIAECFIFPMPVALHRIYELWMVSKTKHIPPSIHAALKEDWICLPNIFT
jgi:hypothetical protein